MFLWILDVGARSFSFSSRGRTPVKSVCQKPPFFEEKGEFESKPGFLNGFAHFAVGAGTKGDGCEFKRGQVMWRLELSLGRGVEEA